MWGWGVDNGASAFQTCTSGCKAGIAGPGDGQFSNPNGVAVDSAGNMYVADFANRRVQKFIPSGGGFTFNRTWGWGVDNGTSAFQICTGGCQAGSAGTGAEDGRMDSPTGVATDSTGNVYVADVDNDRIQKFTATGSFVTKLGGPSFGSGDSQFNNGGAVAVDPWGYLYVADHGNSSIKKFVDGAYTPPIGATPIRVPLVPAFGGCTAANSTHGAPLNFPSCNPPTPASGTVKAGNGSIGQAWIIDCNIGTTSPSCNESAGGFTTAMQPDVRVFGAIRDVQCRLTGTPSGCTAGSDYNPNNASGPYTTACTTAATCGNDGRPTPFCAPGAGSSSACIAGTDVTLSAGLGQPSDTTVDPTTQCGTDPSCLAFASKFAGHGFGHGSVQLSPGPSGRRSGCLPGIGKHVDEARNARGHPVPGSPRLPHNPVGDARVDLRSEHDLQRAGSRHGHRRQEGDSRARRDLASGLRH